MPPALAGLKARMAQYTPKQLVAAGLLVAIVLGASIGLTRWMTAPTYDVLFSGLQPADAQAVVQAVEATGTSYKLTEAGDTSTVLVPADQVARLRMSLAADNIPADSTVGYELLDNQGVTVSTFREQINYQRALEGELARTLMSLDDVTNASVHIVLPRDRLYTEDQTPATASVTLTTAATPDEKEVAAITNLVASAVPDLAASDVTVTDSTGELLAGGADDLGTTGSSDEQDLEAAYASRLENRALTMLTPVVGDGMAVVRVQTDLDFTKRTRQTEVFDPTKVAANKKQSDKEKYASSEPLPQGTVTTDPLTGQPTTPPTSQSDYSHTSSDTDWSVSREISSETDAPGAVKRMTVSVLLDPKAAAAANVNQVRQLVENAVGFDSTRGDKIAVQLIAFNPTKAPAPAQDPSVLAAKAAQKTKMIVGLAIAGVLLLAVLVLAFVLLRGRRKKDAAAAEDDTLVVPAGAAASLAGGTVPANAQLGVPSSSAGEADRLRDRVAENPAAAADVIRGFLASDQMEKR